MANLALSYCGEQVRRYDRERFLTALFVPQPLRDDLLALYAFHLELARLYRTIKEPTMGRIRCQWWRDRLEDIRAGHKVKGHVAAEALADLLHRGLIPFDGVERLIDAQEQALLDSSPQDVTELWSRSNETSGTLAYLAARLLGGDDRVEELARLVGSAYGLVCSLRNARRRAFFGRLDLPLDRLALIGLTPGMAVREQAGEKLAPLVAELADLVRTSLIEARKSRKTVQKNLSAAFFVAILADHGLGRLIARRYNLFDPAILQSSPWLTPRLLWGHWSSRW